MSWEELIVGLLAIAIICVVVRAFSVYNDRPAI
jgi:hypothetical protein